VLTYNVQFDAGGGRTRARKKCGKQDSQNKRNIIEKIFDGNGKPRYDVTFLQEVTPYHMADGTPRQELEKVQNKSSSFVTFKHDRHFYFFSRSQAGEMMATIINERLIAESDATDPNLQVEYETFPTGGRPFQVIRSKNNNVFVNVHPTPPARKYKIGGHAHLSMEFTLKEVGKKISKKISDVLASGKANVIVGGDFNNAKPTTGTLKLKDVTLKPELKTFHTLPSAKDDVTRASAIDHILTNGKFKSVELAAGVTGLSDHCPLLAKIEFSEPASTSFTDVGKVNGYTVIERAYDDMTFSNFITKLKEEGWQKTFVKDIKEGMNKLETDNPYIYFPPVNAETYTTTPFMFRLVSHRHKKRDTEGKNYKEKVRTNEKAVAFLSLKDDCMMVLPSIPHGNPKSFNYFGPFINDDSNATKGFHAALFNKLSDSLEKILVHGYDQRVMGGKETPRDWDDDKPKPVYLSTHGGGESWLHVRLDTNSRKYQPWAHVDQNLRNGMSWLAQPQYNNIPH